MHKKHHNQLKEKLSLKLPEYVKEITFYKAILKFEQFINATISKESSNNRDEFKYSFTNKKELQEIFDEFVIATDKFTLPAYYYLKFLYDNFKEDIDISEKASRLLRLFDNFQRNTYLDLDANIEYWLEGSLLRIQLLNNLEIYNIKRLKKFIKELFNLTSYCSIARDFFIKLSIELSQKDVCSQTLVKDLKKYKLFDIEIIDLFYIFTQKDIFSSHLRSLCMQKKELLQVDNPNLGRVWQKVLSNKNKKRKYHAYELNLKVLHKRLLNIQFTNALFGNAHLQGMLACTNIKETLVKDTIVKNNLDRRKKWLFICANNCSNPMDPAVLLSQMMLGILYYTGKCDFEGLGNSQGAMLNTYFVQETKNKTIAKYYLEKIFITKDKKEISEFKFNALADFMPSDNNGIQLEAMSCLRMIYEEESNYSLAIKLEEKAYALVNILNYHNVCYNLGILYSKNSNDEKSLHYLEKVLEVPENLTAKKFFSSGTKREKYLDLYCLAQDKIAYIYFVNKELYNLKKAARAIHNIFKYERKLISPEVKMLYYYFEFLGKKGFMQNNNALNLLVKQAECSYKDNGIFIGINFIINLFAENKILVAALPKYNLSLEKIEKYMLKLQEHKKLSNYFIFDLYFNKYNPPKFEKAKQFLKKACKEKKPYILNLMGYFYELGQEQMGIKQDLKKAYQYYLKGYELDPNDAHILNNLGTCYLRRKGVKENYILAKTLLEKSYELGNLYAAYNLSWMYDQGCVVEKDPEKVLKLLHEAEQLCDPDVYYDLGVQYILSGNVEKFNFYNDLALQHGSSLAAYTFQMIQFEKFCLNDNLSELSKEIFLRNSIEFLKNFIDNNPHCKFVYVLLLLTQNFKVNKDKAITMLGEIKYSIIHRNILSRETPITISRIDFLLRYISEELYNKEKINVEEIFAVLLEEIDELFIFSKQLQAVQEFIYTYRSIIETAETAEIITDSKETKKNNNLINESNPNSNPNTFIFCKKSSIKVCETLSTKDVELKETDVDKHKKITKKKLDVEQIKKLRKLLGKLSILAHSHKKYVDSKKFKKLIAKTEPYVDKLKIEHAKGGGSNINYKITFKESSNNIKKEISSIATSNHEMHNKGKDGGKRKDPKRAKNFILFTQKIHDELKKRYDVNDVNDVNEVIEDNIVNGEVNNKVEKHKSFGNNEK